MVRQENYNIMSDKTQYYLQLCQKLTKLKKVKSGKLCANTCIGV